MFRILTVCTGNVCRSPMAAVYLAHRLKSAGLECEVRSCGIMALTGQPATDMARRIVAAEGLSLGQHRAQMITPALVHEADVILVMEPWHKEWIVIRIPEVRDRIIELADYLDDPAWDAIPDPYGGEPEDYEFTWHLICRAVDRWLEARFGITDNNVIIRR